MTDETIFATALEKADPAERAAYLDDVCAGDTERRQRLEGLLAAHPRAERFLERPVVDPRDSDLGDTLAVDREGSAPADDEEGSLGFLAPPTRPNSLGRLGHYEMLQVLGKGDFGVVFRAFDDILQRVVAVKVLAPQTAATSPARKRFLREARSSAQVRHENVVQVHEVVEQPLPYLAMEFIPGETLQQKLDRVGPLDLLETLRIGRQVAEGLAAAHDHDLIHRDVKPGNILVESGPRGHAKITDFGLARAVDDASISQSGIVAGTPMYMAPEQAQGRPLDHRADLFSLGSVLYQMVAGRPPFRANSTVAVLKRIAEDQPRAIREIIPETPQWLCDIIAKLHAKNPDDRYQSAREVADVLADCEAQLKANAKLTDHSRIPRSSPQRSGRKWLAAAAVLLLPVIALAVTEFTGVTQLFRWQRSPLPSVANQGPPAADTKVADASGKEPDPTKVPEEKKSPTPDPKPPVEVAQPTPTVHDIWIKALVLLPPDQHAAALPARLKERLPAFDDAFCRGIPSMSADRQGIMAKAWLKERHPAFAGREDAWLELIPRMAADAQVVLVAAWLRERNPAFEGAVTHKIDGGVVTSLEIPSRAIQDLSPLRALTGLKTLTCRSTLGWDNKAESDAAVLRSLRVLETINGKPVAQFWKDAETRQAEFKEWCQLVPTLTAPQQAAAVVAKLKERNPGFESRVRQKIEDGAITEFGVTLDQVTDISPIRVLGALRVLNCIGKQANSPANAQQLLDLTPLRGMNLAHLTYLNLRTTYVGDADMALFKDCRNLTTLNLTWTKVSDAGMVYFKDCKDLSSLNLYDTQVGDAGLAHFKDCKNLTYLYLVGTQVTDTGLGHFKDCKDLMDLFLDRTQVGDAGLAHFKDCKNLRWLQLPNTQVGDAGLAQFKHCKDLTYLNLIGTKVSDTGLGHFKDCKDLSSLFLADTQVGDAGLAHFKDCKNLSSLYLDVTQVGDAGLAHFKGMPLKALSIHNTSITDLTPLQGMPLETIRLTPKNITKGLDILRDMKSLKTIGISWKRYWPAAEFWDRHDKGEFKE